VVGISYVVDSGYEYESTFDPVLRESTLVNKFIPKAAVKQRMGRAGRTKPGICYHMYTKDEYAKFDDYKHAEITTGNIDNLVLKMLHYRTHGDAELNTGKLVDIFSSLIEPPAKKRVEATIRYLSDLEVLTKDGQISDLGLCVYRLNVDVPVALFLIACRKKNVDPSVAITLASIILIDPNYSGWFRKPARMVSDYQSQMKKYNALTARYTSDYAEVLALYKLYQDFREDKVKLWKRWLNIKHLVEVPRQAQQLKKNYEAMETKCMEVLTEPKPSSGGPIKWVKAELFEDQIVSCLYYGYRNQMALLKLKQKPIYKFEVKGVELIDVEPEAGNGISKFSSRILYFALSNILGERRFNGLVNLPE
jgi:pre-mRNA-splicing factor ATP-dependent RNA helicase DHX15/PRP43